MTTPLEAIDSNDLAKLKASLQAGDKLPAKPAILTALRTVTNRGDNSFDVLGFLLSAGLALTADDVVPLIRDRSQSQEGALTIEQSIELMGKLEARSLKEPSWKVFIEEGGLWQMDWTLLFNFFGKQGAGIPPGVLTRFTKSFNIKSDADLNDAILLNVVDPSELKTLAASFALDQRPLSLAGLHKVLEAKVEASEFPHLVVKKAGAEKAPAAELYALTHLVELVLSGFAEVSPKIANLQKLTKLTLQNIGVIPEAIASLPALVELSVSMESLPQVFAHPPPGLTTLYVMSGNLPEFPPGIRALQSLEVLHVGFGGADSEVTGLTTLPAEIGELKNLRDLRFGCDLKTLPREIALLPLEYIYFESKTIKLPKEFGEIKTLEKRLMARVLKQVAREATAPGAASGPGVFAGQKWCVTGTLENYHPRQKAEALIQAQGGLIAKGVDKTVTHLLVGADPGDDKLGKAKKLGVTTVDEKAFERMLKQPAAAPKAKVAPQASKVRAEVEAAIRDRKWEGDVGAILKTLQPAISLSATQKKAAVGTSKLGGRPDLPKILKWPTIPDEDGEGHVPLTFIAQLNIKDFKHLDFDSRLPADGLIYLFMYLLRDGIQDDYAGGGQDEWVKVLYCPESAASDLKTAATPKKLQDAEKEDLVGVLEEHALSFTEDYTLPEKDGIKPALSAADAKVLSTVIDEVIPKITKGRTESQVLGHPQSVQGGAAGRDDFFFQLSESLGSFDRCITDGAFYFFVSPEDVQRGDFSRASGSSEYT